MNRQLSTSTDNDRWFVIAQQLVHQAGVEFNGGNPWDIQVLNPSFYRRVLQQGVLGLGESYMEGWWECERLDEFFHRAVGEGLDKQLPEKIWALVSILCSRLFNRQSRRRSWVVGRKHYDLGNDLFEAILDSHMQYSCGYWYQADNLEQAQVNKLDLICRKLQLQPGMKMLDIGCGWGGLAHYAASQYGVSVVGVTVSGEQVCLARKRCQGLDVDIRLQDYRDVNDSFDRIASVGMFEHVGPRNYRAFFEVAARNLKPDGLFLLHTIGSLETGYRVNPWTEKFIFPNGCLPSTLQIARGAEGLFVMEDWHNFGADYDRTLMQWEQRFVNAWPQLKKRYGPVFYRMFRFYLLSCAGAFRARDLQLWQILFSPSGVCGGIRVGR